MNQNNSHVNNHHNNHPNLNDNYKPIKLSNNENNNSIKPTSSYYRDFLIGLTKSALLFCLVLSIFLVALAAFSSPFSSTANQFLPVFSTTATTLTPLLRNSNLFDQNLTLTKPHHILFSLSGSAATWPNRRHYSQIWWSAPNLTRGFVWLDQVPPGPGHGPQTGPDWASEPALGPLNGPGLMVSSGPGRPDGPVKASDRIARILKESFELGIPDIRWFVMGDDDTVFFPENLAAVLGKYDHRKLYYVGSNSESVEQDVRHGYGMAFGGGGFAVSYGLACELVPVLDGCIERYHELYGSDEKVAACVAELGIPLTKHPGFHQLDIRGDPYGLLAAHPVAPLLSLHHLDYISPIFPGLTRVDSLKKVMQSYHIDPGLTLQQSFCYDYKLKWSLSVSWGYTAQLYPTLVSSRLITTPLQTFRTWGSSGEGPFVFNTRPFVEDLCRRPIVYFLERVQDIGEGTMLSVYKRFGVDEAAGKCDQSAYKYALSVENITVTATKSSLNEWLKAPRRRCCEITNSRTMKSNMEVKITRCKPTPVTVVV